MTDAQIKNLNSLENWPVTQHCIICRCTSLTDINWASGNSWPVGQQKHAEVLGVVTNLCLCIHLPIMPEGFKDAKQRLLDLFQGMILQVFISNGLWKYLETWSLPTVTSIKHDQRLWDSVDLERSDYAWAQDQYLMTSTNLFDPAQKSTALRLSDWKWVFECSLECISACKVSRSAWSRNCTFDEFARQGIFCLNGSCTPHPSRNVPCQLRPVSKKLFIWKNKHLKQDRMLPHSLDTYTHTLVL